MKRICNARPAGNRKPYAPKAEVAVCRALCLSDLDSPDSGGPRIRDVRLGECLRMRCPRDVRRQICRTRQELEACGPLFIRRDPVWADQEFWLNEAQILLLCMQNHTAEASRVRHEVLDVYARYQNMVRYAPPCVARLSSCSAQKDPDGRYLVVVRGGGVADVRPLAGHCMVDGADPENLATFLREYVPDTGVSAALNVLLRRLRLPDGCA